MMGLAVSGFDADHVRVDWLMMDVTLRCCGGQYRSRVDAAGPSYAHFQCKTCQRIRRVQVHTTLTVVERPAEVTKRPLPNGDGEGGD